MLFGHAHCSFPARTMPSFPSTIDTLIIGAGAAGLAAARRLQAAGQAVLVLEAAQRVGGRAWTDTTTFSAPIDRGFGVPLKGSFLTLFIGAVLWWTTATRRAEPACWVR